MNRFRHLVSAALLSRNCRRFRLGRRPFAVALLASMAIVVIGAGVAYAYFQFIDSSNAHTAKAVAGSLSAPTTPTATVNGSGAITIGWTLPGTQLSGVQYKVTRTSGPGSPTTVCTVASTITSCQDTGLTGGSTYGYSVIAVLATNWQSSAIAASATTATPTFTIATTPVGPFTAGTASAVQSITAKVAGITDTTYSGTKALTWSGLNSSPSGQAPTYPSAAVTFTNGVGTPTNPDFTAYEAGTSRTLTASDNATPSVQGSISFTVNPAIANTFTVPTPTTQTAGNAFNVAITAKDLYGNTATSYTGSKVIVFSGPSNSPNATAPTYPANVTFTAGAGTASITLVNAQSTTLTATQSTITGTTGSFTVNPATANTFTVPTPTTQTAGNAFNVAITAKDLYGNTATSYTGSKVIVFSGPSNSPNATAPTYPANVTFTAGAGTASITLVNAQSTTLTATQSTITGTTGSFTVNPATASNLFVAAATATPTAGAADNLTITAKDAFGNTATAYTGDKSLTFAGASTIGTNNPTVSNNTGVVTNFGTTTTITFTNGVSTVSGANNGVMKLYKVEATNITVTDGTLNSGTGLSVTVNPATAHHFSLAGPGSTPTAGSSFNLVSLAALDQYGNQPTGYTGPKTIDWTGANTSPSGAVPSYPTASVTFNTSGVATTSLTATFNAAGANGLTATDHNATSIVGNTSITVSAGTATRLAWTHVAVSAGTLSSPCLFTCTDTGLGNNANFTANVSVTDALGNTVTTLGAGHTVTVSTPASGGGSGGAFTAPTSGTSVTLTISSTGAADSTQQFTFRTQNGSWSSDTFAAATASGTSYTGSTATVTKT